MNFSEIKRTPNFTPAEKESLINIIQNYAHILEDKKTNRVTIEEKSEVWKKIEVDFNNKAPIACYRNADQLKRLYENKKKEHRRKLAEEKRQRFLTGGGPPPPNLNLDYFDEILMKILKEKTIRGMDVPFDSDTFTEPLEKKQKQNEIEFEFSSDLPTKSDIEIVIDDTTEEASESLLNFGRKRCPPKQFQSILSSELRQTLSVSTSCIPPRLGLKYNECEDEIISETPMELPLRKEKLNMSFAETSDIYPKLGETSGTTPKVRNRTTLVTNRKRPTTGLKTLTSSDVSAKYNILLDRRLVLVENQIEQAIEMQNFAREEAKEKNKVLQIQKEVLSLEKEEKKIKVELLKIELINKKSF